MSDDSSQKPRVVEAINHAIELHSRGETQSAVQLLSALADELPQVALLQGYLARLLANSGQFEQALEHGSRAVFLSPESEKVSLLYSNTLWRAGKHIEALDEMKRFIRIKPSPIYSKMIQEWDLSAGEKLDFD